MIFIFEKAGFVCLFEINLKGKCLELQLETI